MPTGVEQPGLTARSAELGLEPRSPGFQLFLLQDMTSIFLKQTNKITFQGSLVPTRGERLEQKGRWTISERLVIFVPLRVPPSQTSLLN